MNFYSLRVSARVRDKYIKHTQKREWYLGLRLALTSVVRLCIGGSVLTAYLRQDV